jgi:hypothetical protein
VSSVSRPGGSEPRQYRRHDPIAVRAAELISAAFGDIEFLRERLAQQAESSAPGRA